jgi:transposase InsO family protein
MVADFARLSITIDRVMTDNGSCYCSKAFVLARRQLGIKHLMTKPDTHFKSHYATRLIVTWKSCGAPPTPKFCRDARKNHGRIRR